MFASDLRGTRLAARPICASLALIIAVGAGGSSALAQNADYDPQPGSETGPYKPPHTGGATQSRLSPREVQDERLEERMFAFGAGRAVPHGGSGPAQRTFAR
jgi:hypothetical protein